MSELKIDDQYFYPNAQLAVGYPGFVKIPILNDNLIINREGTVIRSTTGKILKQTLTAAGYFGISVRVDFKIRTVLLVHRLIALMFIRVPVRHADRDRSELQVNHKDANKKNNAIENLEWVTPKENMDHAYDLGLNPYIKRPVCAKELSTGEVKSFETIRACCKYFCLDKNMLFKHLNSSAAGRIIGFGHVFKYDNEQEWPELLAEEHPDTTLWRSPDIVAKNLETGEILLFLNLSQIAEYLGVSFPSLRNHRFRKGTDVPLNGWLFYPLARECFRPTKRSHDST